VKSVTLEPDDFASIYEVLSRRFKRARDGSAGWELPDLVVIDGGKGQLGAALAAARDQGVDVGPQGLPVVGLAKEKEKEKPDRVFLPRIKDPIPLRGNSAEMFVLARIRDEAHRFANRYHQEMRKKRTLRSSLSMVPGIGAKRQRELLKTFGSLKKIRELPIAELATAPGMTLAAATALHGFLHGPDPVVEAERPETGTVEDAEAAALADAGGELEPPDPPLPDPSFFINFGQDKIPGDMKLLPGNITGKFHNFHSVPEGRRNRVQDIGGGNKKDLGQVKRYVQIMVHKGMILFRVQNLQNGAGRVPLKTNPNFINLIKKNEGVIVPHPL
jgi:hypothetical protein